MYDSEDPEVSRVAIVFFRALRGWSQAELARAAGLSASAVSRYEQGHEVPSRRTLARAAAAVGLPPHLVERCLALIRSALAALAGGDPAAEPLAGLEALAGELAAGLEELVRAAVARVLAAVPGLAPGPWSSEPPPAAEPPERGEELWQRFADCTAEERLLLVEKTTEFRSWRLSVRVCEESLRAAADDADAAAELAALALRIAELAPGKEAWRLRLRGFALYHLGNARRVKGELREADEETFPEARRLWREGATGDPGLLNEARVLHLEASLKKDQRALREALGLLDRAAAADSQAMRSRESCSTKPTS